MLLDLSGYAAPTSLVAAAGLKQNVLSWDDYPDRDHVKFAVYRYPTLTDANNDTNRIFLGFTRNSEFKDAANHTAGTTQWYRVSSIDRDDNESVKSAVASVVHKRVGSGDLDNGAVLEVNVDPNLPVALGTPPVLTSVVADIDQDGTPDLGFTVSWGAIAASGVNPAARLYEVEIHRSATVGGTYTLWRTFTTPNTSYVFEARRKWFHKARVRGLSFANQTGNNWSGLTATGLQPNAYSASLNASAPSVAQVANGYRITWTKPADKTYKETEVLVGGVALIRVTGNVYVDTTARAIGDTPSYTVRHFDRADNVGTTSTATVAPAYRASTSAEVGVLAAANIGNGIIGDTKLSAGRNTNLIMNSDARLGAINVIGPCPYWKEESDNTAADFLLWGGGSAWALLGEQTFVIQQGNGTSTGQTDVVYCDEYGNIKKIPVAAGTRLELSLFTGAHRCIGEAHLAFYNSSDALISDHFTDTNPQTHSGGQFLAGYKRLSLFVTAPAGAAYAILRVRKRATAAGASPANSYMFWTRVFLAEAGTNQTELSPWHYAGEGLVTIGATDRTQLAAPTGLALALHTQDVDGDGKLDTVYKATCGAVANAVAYEFEFSRSDTSGGTYTVVETVQSPTPMGTHKVIIGKWYKVVARAIGFNGTRGLPSAAVGPVQPTGASTISGTTPAAPGVAQIANGYRISFPVPTDKTYRETEILVGGVPLTRTAAGVFVDTTARNVGDTPSYTIRHYDRSLASSNVSGATVGPAYRQVQTSEIADNAAIPSKVSASDGELLHRDTEMIDLSVWTTAVTGGTISSFVSVANPTADGFGSSRNRLRAISSGGSTRTAILTGPDISVQPLGIYEVSAYVGPTVPAVVNRGIRALFYTLDGSGNPVFHSALNLTLDTPIALAPYGPIYISGIVKVPSGCVRMAIEAYDETTDLVVASLRVSRRKALKAGASNIPATGSFGTAVRQLVALSFDHGSGVKMLLVSAYFKTSVAATATIRIVVDGAVVAFRNNNVCRDGTYVEISGAVALPASDTSTIELTFEGAAAGNNVNNAFIEAVALI